MKVAVHIIALKYRIKYETDNDISLHDDERIESNVERWPFRNSASKK